MKHTIQAENAQKIWEWFQTRGGISVWKSINLSNIGASWTSPRLQENGEPTIKPTWQAANEPAFSLTDPADCLVEEALEVKRFHVAIRRGSQGLSFKLTDASSAKVRKAVAKAAETQANHEAWHDFDYETQEAIIYVPKGRAVPLPEYIVKQLAATDQLQT